MILDRCILGDCRDVMRQLIADGVRVQTIVTSPPYFGLRDYGVAGQIGLESTLQEFVATMVEVFDVARDLLVDDGTLWVNLGDSYAASRSYQVADNKNLQAGPTGNGSRAKPPDGLKQKDLCGVPWRVAFALQASGWVLRQEIIWNKPNPMPESVNDRCTKAHEQLFLFSKAKWKGPMGGRFAHISDADARWLALCIDTEGCIVVKRVKQNDGGADSFAPQVTFGGTSRDLVERFREIVGYGNIAERTGKNSPMLYWQLSNNVARDFLYRIYPYLIVKQRQARLGIYVDSLTYYRGGKMPERKMRSDTENRVLMSLWERNKQCNKFGDPDLSDVPEPIYGRWDSQRYYFDQEAIKEPANSSGDYKMPDGWDTGAGGHGSFHRNGREKGRKPGNVNPPKGQIAYEAGDARHRTKAGLLAYAERSRRDSFMRETKEGAVPGQGALQHREDRTESAYDVTKRNKRSVWTIATESYSEAHFATFPQALVEPCILAGSRPGDIVFDPFMGSGTVAQVAQRLGRRWLGAELNLAYIELQADRTRQAGLVLG